MNAKEYLKTKLEQEYRTYFGLPPRKFFDGTVEAWMDDATNAKHRFDSIEKYLPGAKRILDMASGCGSAVYFGLLNGYDMTGIDPEKWKHIFNAMKAAEFGYPLEWQARFHEGVGENLPFQDNHFDCVTTYQTLEHVQDVDRVIEEMIRVTRPGGGIHIRCPDYFATFEGHYRIPWFPLFPRPLAKVYLVMLGKQRAGLDTIQYVTTANILRSIRRALEKHPEWKLKVVDVEEESFLESKRWKNAAVILGAFRIRRQIQFLKVLFRQEMTVHLFVYVLEK